MPMLSAEDLRALLARRRVRLYEIAPEVGLHPSRLGMILNGRLPLTEEMGLKILQALEEAALP